MPETMIYNLCYSDWCGIKDFLFRRLAVPCQPWPYTSESSYHHLRQPPMSASFLDWLCLILAALLEPTHWAVKFLYRLNLSFVVSEISSFDRVCKAYSGLVCVATWNCRRMTSESSRVFLMACCRMTSRVFALFTPSLESAVSIADLVTPTVKLYWAVVQVAPFFRDAYKYTPGGERIWCSSRGLCPVPSLGTIRPPCTSRVAQKRHF